VPVTLDEARKSPINLEKCEIIEQQIIDILNKEPGLNLKELILVLAQTLIDVGGTLEKVDTKLTYTDMWRRYAVEPTLGNALMAQGSDILHDWLKIPDNDNEEQEKE
jgi:hypothetical protein